MTVLHHELEVVPGISLMGAGQLKSEMLCYFGPAFCFAFRMFGKIIDPENARLVGIERSRGAIGRGGELLAEKIGDGKDFQLFAAGQTDQPRGGRMFFDRFGDGAVFGEQVAGRRRPFVAQAPEDFMGGPASELGRLTTQFV